jgi:ABC-type uncharacterized transport system permease subunit
LTAYHQTHENGSSVGSEQQYSLNFVVERIAFLFILAWELAILNEVFHRFPNLNRCDASRHAAH